MGGREDTGREAREGGWCRGGKGGRPLRGFCRLGFAPPFDLLLLTGEREARVASRAGVPPDRLCPPSSAAGNLAAFGGAGVTGFTPFAGDGGSLFVAVARGLGVLPRGGPPGVLPRGFAPFLRLRPIDIVRHAAGTRAQDCAQGIVPHGV